METLIYPATQNTKQNYKVFWSFKSQYNSNLCLVGLV